MAATWVRLLGECTRPRVQSATPSSLTSEIGFSEGAEPSAQNPQPAENQPVTNDGEKDYTQPRAQIQGNDWRDLSQVVAAWGELPAALKAV